jgi:hypothetical protein
MQDVGRGGGGKSDLQLEYPHPPTPRDVLATPRRWPYVTGSPQPWHDPYFGVRPEIVQKNINTYRDNFFFYFLLEKLLTGTTQTDVKMLRHLVFPTRSVSGMVSDIPSFSLQPNVLPGRVGGGGVRPRR